MEELSKTAFRQSNIYYYSIFALAVIIAGCGYLFKQNYQFIIDPTIVVAISSVAMLYLVASIPFALWFFNKKTKTLGEIEKTSERFAFYMKHLKLRMSLVGINFLLNILLFYTLSSTSFLYAAAIGAVGMLFCKPNKNMIEADLNPIIEEDETC